MPPTAHELKARLDKAVDQEGNVLDMETVLEIVTYLEKTVITKEALETTRIGRTINLMRKKTTNEDLSRRAKKLVKKWQTLVSNHLKKTFKSDSPLNFPSTPPPVNGLKLKSSEKNHDRPSSTELESKPNLKRKRTSAENSPLNLRQSHSPGLTYSPRSISSPRNKLVRVVTEKTLSSSPRNACVASKTLAKADEQNSASSVLNTDRLHNAEVQLKTPVEGAKNHINNNTIKSVENGHSKLAVVTATDTRCQEDRIDSTTTGEIVSSSPDTLTDSLLLPHTDIQIVNSHQLSPRETLETQNETQEVTPRTFDSITPEDLALSRKQLPLDHLSPDVEADGVNGVYSTDDSYCSWSDIILQRNNELHLLPYVILD